MQHDGCSNRGTTRAVPNPVQGGTPTKLPKGGDHQAELTYTDKGMWEGHIKAKKYKKQHSIYRDYEKLCFTKGQSEVEMSWLAGGGVVIA